MNTEPEAPTKVPMTVIKLIPRTREQRRQAKRETQMIVRTLLPIDTMFNRAMLADTTEKADEVSYEALYKIFLNMWRRHLDILAHKRLQIVAPNVTYFVQSYAPKNATE
jgi:hypothetical protein